MEPVYIETFNKGLFKEKIEKAFNIIRLCTLCPRKCKVDRFSGKTGICKTGKTASVSSYGSHFGEEAPLVGTGGSGAIFFTHCNLLCTFCQNYEISLKGTGEKVSDEELAGIMIDLQNRGSHNINFVTPSHVVPQILAAVEIAVKNGLYLPLIYNTGGYDSVETLKLLEGVFDIYMPDFKFWDSQIAETTCKAKDYPEVARKALIEMHRQVGDLVLDESGLAVRGLLLRHLVLPADLAGTRAIMRFIANKILTGTYVNIMSQYRPCGKAYELKELSTPLSHKDYEAALRAAKEEKITRLDLPRRVFMIR